MISAIPQISKKRRRRRSKRLALSVAVLVHGKNASGTVFRQSTRTLSLDANGALFVLAARIPEGQTILVENRNTRQEQACRVVYVRPAQNGKWFVGVAFIHPAPGFWHIHFPPNVSN